jgi:phage-related protein
MADRTGRIEIQTQVDQNLQAALGGLNASIRSTLQTIHELNKTTSNSANSAQALSRAFTGANSAGSLYARSVDNLSKNQIVLAKHFRESAQAASELSRMMASNTSMTNQERVAVDNLVKSLNAQQQARKGVMQYSAQADLRRQSDALNQLANRYSMSGMRMSMALTLPITGFMRTAFSSFKAVEKESVRTSKIISDSYTKSSNAIDASGKQVRTGALEYTKVIDGQIVKVQTLEGAMKSLGTELDKVSMKYGISRELVQGLANDFAELGIEEVGALGNLADLTVAIEKLGNVDVDQSQEFLKSILQTILRMKRETGTLEMFADGTINYGEAVKETRQQLALFNLMENKTQMSLKSTADAFPEVTAAAVSFGLTMSEAMALVAPMVSAGFQVGASANSVKVSLQRMVDLTKENSTMIDTLRQNYAGFNFEAGVSIDTIQDLTYAYQNMQKGDLGAQGTLEFFSSLFGVRQGPRMAVAIQSLAQFQDQITKGLNALASGDVLNRTVEGDLIDKLEKSVQRYSKFQGLGKEFTEMKIKDFKGLGEIVRLSQEGETEQVRKAMTAARDEVGEDLLQRAKRGEDLISKITTESGRAMLIGALGNKQAADKFEQEVQAALSTVQTRYDRGREAFKAIGRQLVPILAQALDVLVPILIKINELFDRMPGWSKAFITFGLLALAAVGPILKIVGSITQLRSGMLGIAASGGIFGKFKKQSQVIEAEFISADSAALRFKNRLTEIGGKFHLEGTKKEIKDLKTLMQLEAMPSGDLSKRDKRQMSTLQKRLGVGKNAVDLSGLSERTKQSLQTGLDPNMLGYRRDEFRDPNSPASIQTYQKAGQTIGLAFLAILRAQGFNPNIVARTAARAATATTVTVPPGAKRVGGSPPPPPPAPPTPPPAPPSGGSPRPPAPAPAPAPAPRTLPMRDPVVINNNIPTPASAIPMPAVPAVKEVVTPDSGGGARRIKRLSDEVSNSLKNIETTTKKELLEMARSMKIKGTSKMNVNQLRSAVMDAIAAPKQVIEEAVTKAVSDTKKTSKSVQTKAPPATQNPEVKQASDEGTKAVQSTQAKNNAQAVKKQAQADQKAVESAQTATLTAGSGIALEGISQKARSVASTVDQMKSNVANVISKAQDSAFTVDSIIKSLQLVGEGTRRVPFTFTKQKFFELANILGIQLPPIFNKMGELVDKNGNQLRLTKESLIKLIQSMTRIGQAPAILTNIAGQTVLEFEGEVNKALALGAGSKKMFNFKGITGKVQDAFSLAFGNIFADASGKMGVTKEAKEAFGETQQILEKQRKKKIDELLRITPGTEISPTPSKNELKQLAGIGSKQWRMTGQRMAFDASQVERQKAQLKTFGSAYAVRVERRKSAEDGAKQRYVDLAYTPEYLKERKELGLIKPTKKVTDNVRAIREQQLKIARMYQEILSKSGIEAATEFADMISKSVKGKPTKTKANLTAIKNATDSAYRKIMNLDRADSMGNLVDQMLANREKRMKGGGTGTTSVGMGASMMDPFGGLGGPKETGRRAPRIGPNLAFVDKGAITGGVTSVYEEIRQALKIPANIMDQVIADLKVRHAKITAIGTTSKNEIGAGLNELIISLQTNLQGVDLTVENVKQAIIAQRNAVYKLGEKVKPKAASSKAEQDAMVASIMESIVKTKTATRDFMSFTDRPLRKLAEALNKLITDPALKIDTRANMATRKVQITNALQHLGVTVEKAIVETAVKPVQEATSAVKISALQSARNQLSALGANTLGSTPITMRPTPVMTTPVSIRPRTPSGPSMTDRLDAQLQRSARRRLSDLYLNNPMTPSSIMQSVSPAMPKVKENIFFGMEKINLGAIGKSMAGDFLIFGREVKDSGSMMKSILMQGFGDIRGAISTAPDPSRVGRLIRGFLNPLRLAEGGLSGFGKTINTVFSPSRIEYLSRALGGTAPLMKYRKTDPLTGAPMPPITGFANRARAIPARTLMGLGQVVQNSNMFPNLQALLQQTYGAYLPTEMSMGSGRGGRTRLTESSQRRTGMGGILDANLTRAGVAPARRVTQQAADLSAQLFKNITPSGFETGLASVVKTVSDFTNKLLTGSQKVNGAIESVGRGVGMSLRVAGRVITIASAASVPLMIQGYKAIGSATIKGISGLIGNIDSALKVVSAMGRVSGGGDFTKFANRLRKGAKAGAGVASFSKMSEIDLANLTLKQKLGALAGIISVAGAQFGMTATKISAQVTGAMLQLTLKLVPFSGTIMNVGAQLFNTAKAMQAASSGANTLTGKLFAMGKAATKAGTGMVGKAAGGVRTMIFGAPAGPGGQPEKKGLLGGAKGMMTGMKGGVMGGAGTAMSMLSYQFGMVGMIAGPILINIIQKLAMIPVVGGPIILVIMAIVGAFMFLKKTTKAWSEYSNGAIEKFKQAWGMVKTIFSSLLSPVFDFFASFLGGSSDGEKGMESLGNTIGSIADKVLEILPKIQDFINKYIEPAIRQFLSGFKLIIEAIWPVIKAVIDFVKIFVNLFKGDFGGAWDAVKSMFGNLKDAAGKLLKGIIVMLAPILKLIVTLFFAMVTAIINILEQIPIFFVNSLRWMAKASIQLFFSGMVQPIIFVVDIILTAISKLVILLIRAVQFIAKAYVNAWFTIAKAFLFVVDQILEGVGAIVAAAGRAFGWIPGIGGKIKDAAAGFGKSLGGAMDVWRDRAQGAQNTILNVIDTIGNRAAGFAGGLAGIGNALGDIAQNVQNGLMSGVDTIADWLTGKIGSLSNLSAMGRNAINSFIDGLVAGNMIEKGVGDTFKKETDKAFKDPTVVNAAGKAIGDAIGEALSSLNESFFDAVVGNLSDAIKDAASEVTDILNQQKEDALKAYDDQIEGINALAEAEERLTATEEYEADRRKRIRDRELQRNNYQKNRALAIYEGRVDDARNLDLEELKNVEDFNKDMADSANSRQRDLQGQNRTDAISIIKRQRDAASELFEESIREFEEYVEEVTRNGTISETQLTEQWGRIAAQANLTSTGINDTFRTSFSQLGPLITSGLNPSTSEAGFFSTEMGRLVTAAANSFGLTAGIPTADATSVLGITAAALTSPTQGIPSVITSAFAAGGIIQGTYGTGITSLATYLAAKNDPANSESLAAIFRKAIADANTAMEQELLKAQRGIGSAFDTIVTGLNTKVKGLAIAEGVKKGMEEAAKEAREGAKKVVEAAQEGAASATDPSTGMRTWFAIKGSNGRWGDWFIGGTKRAIETYEGLVKTDPRNYKSVTSVDKPAKLFRGGLMKYIMGGITEGGMHQEIPAILHGGEFVVRKSAVDKYGLDMLNQINKGIYMPKKPMVNVPMSSYAKIAAPSSSGGVMTSESTHNYNIYVDNFIGETEWFNSMMKDYNMKVVPANQKQAGLESRVIKTYNGINRGM